MTAAPLWFCLHFPRLPVEVFARHQQDEPVVVLNQSRVCCMNQCAEGRGIRTGSSMNTACTVSEQVKAFERDESRELACLQQLAQWALRFSPDISVRPPCSLLIKVTGCLKLFGGRDPLRQCIQAGLDELGFTAVIGANGTPLAALCFAEAGAPDTAFKTGDDVRASLRALPVAALRLEPGTRESLAQMGIVTCGQLLVLPSDGLARRFGVFFTDYLQRLTGEKPDPQTTIDETPRFRADITFMSDVTNSESLVFPMKRLLGELQDFLQGRQLQVSQFSFRMAHRNHGSRTFTVSLAEPDNDARMFLMLAQLQLEKLDSLPETDNLALAANHFEAMQTHAGDLFEGTRFEHRDGSVHSKTEQAQAVRLINMMTARLGRQACFGLATANDHRPERAWRPVTPGRKNEAGGTTPNARPAYLLHTPRRLSVISTLPAMAGPLELLAGPERIEVGWWDDLAVARDYFIARHPCGALYWIYRDLHHHDWYLHGIFS